jgi:hypothetical protein
MIENGLILTGGDAELLSRALLPLTDLDQPALRVSVLRRHPVQFHILEIGLYTQLLIAD